MGGATETVPERLVIFTEFGNWNFKTFYLELAKLKRQGQGTFSVNVAIVNQSPSVPATQTDFVFLLYTIRMPAR